MKPDLKTRAIRFRKQGLSYSEILKEVPVAKSTLSLWLRHVRLQPEQKTRLREKMKTGQPYGARAQKKKRLKRTKKIIIKAKKEIGNISNKNLFYMGAMLYWAEGSKQKRHNPSQRVTFSNSDPQMIRFHIKWLTDCLNIDIQDIDFEIYSHENIREREKDIVKYWGLITGFSLSKFDRIYYKRDKKKKYRKNQGKNYNGLLRVKVRKSTDLNRKITGWIEGICIQCGMV